MTETEEKQVKSNKDDHTIFIGSKPFMNLMWVFSINMQLRDWSRDAVYNTKSKRSSH